VQVKKGKRKMAESKPIPKEQKVALAIIGIIGLYMFYTRAYAPQGKQIKDLKTKIETNRNKIEDIKIKIRKLDQIEAEFEKLKGRLKEAEKKLPKSEELPSLIRKITDIGKKYNIEVDNLQIGSLLSRQYYQEHLYNFRIKADYHKIAQFFTDICQEERIMTVKDVRLTPVSSDKGISELEGTFVLVVYTYKG